MYRYILQSIRLTEFHNSRSAARTHFIRNLPPRASLSLTYAAKVQRRTQWVTSPKIQYQPPRQRLITRTCTGSETQCLQGIDRLWGCWIGRSGRYHHVRSSRKRAHAWSITRDDQAQPRESHAIFTSAIGSCVDQKWHSAWLRHPYRLLPHFPFLQLRLIIYDIISR